MGGEEYREVKETGIPKRHFERFTQGDEAADGQPTNPVDVLH